jgi:hypothetical protein
MWWWLTNCHLDSTPPSSAPVWTMGDPFWCYNTFFSTLQRVKDRRAGSFSCSESNTMVFAANHIRLSPFPSFCHSLDITYNLERIWCLGQEHPSLSSISLSESYKACCCGWETSGWGVGVVKHNFGSQCGHITCWVLLKFSSKWNGEGNHMKVLQGPL